MNKIIKVFLWSLAFLPLFVDNSIFAPANANFFLRIILWLVSILILAGLVFSLEFKREIFQKIKLFIKNPVILSVLAFIFIFIISTIFAVDKNIAFWGEIQRVEGLVGILYLFSFFVFSFLIFKKDDWLWFFKLSLFATLILLSKEFMQFLNGTSRPDSFVGNPTFLAGYLIFSISYSLILFSEIKNKFWKYFSIIILIFSVLGIFITQTRGSILGIIFGFLGALIFFIFKGKNIFYIKISLRKLTIIFLSIFFIFSVVFIATKKDAIWQKIPGISRIAEINKADSTTNTRLLTSEISLEAVNPIQNGIKKFLIGWGPDNFGLAYAKYFNPEQFNYEVGWFDRAHDKFLDLFVMQGILGLLAYLAIYFFLIKDILKKNFSYDLKLRFTFFFIAYIVHLLFIFDQITTLVPFFAIIAFILCFNISNESDKNTEKDKIKKEKNIFAGVFFLFLSLFLSFVFFKNDLPSFAQIKEYDSLREKNSPDLLLNNIDSVFKPFTVAQMKIRYDFLALISANYDPKKEFILKMDEIALSKAEEYADKRPFDLQFLIFLAGTYTNQGVNFNNPEFLKKGEGYFRRILPLATTRLDVNYGLATNLFFQGRYEEAFNYFEGTFNSNPKYFSRKGNNIISVYTHFIKYFYEKRDKEKFIKTVNRLKSNNYYNSEALDEVMSLINKDNIWPSVNFR